MLKSEYKTLQSLSHSHDPLTSLWNSFTVVLSTNEEENGSYIRVEIVIDHEVPLAKVGIFTNFAVVKMVKNLSEP